MRILLLFTVSVILFCGCTQKSNNELPPAQGKEENIAYAAGFRIFAYTGYKKIIVRNPLDTSLVLATYYLVHDLKNIPVWMHNENVVQVPVNKFASLSTTHLGFIEALGLEEKITAFNGTRYVYNQKVRSLIDNGTIREAGEEGTLNYELLASLHPDIIMAYNMGDPSYDHFDKLTALHLHPVLNNEYLELTPLGEADWIKYVAAFFDEEEKADSVFTEIEEKYNEIKNKALSSTVQPTVFTGLSYRGEWTIPGGKSFAANFLRDAGADYLWKDDTRTGNFPVSMESVLMKAAHADYWLNPGGAVVKDDVIKSDSRNSFFPAYKNGNLFNNNRRMNSSGGNDYWESGVVNPQWILADLVKIFHPEVLPEYEFTYYQKLQ